MEQRNAIVSGTFHNIGYNGFTVEKGESKCTQKEKL